MEWTRGRAIGRGSSATVWVATARGSGEVFAVKSVELSKSECLRRERDILSSLNSPRVIAYKGFDATTSRGPDGDGEGVFNLFMELALGGSLSDELRRRRGGSLSLAESRAAAREILSGLRYLHAQGIAHCDVKAGNVLVTCEGLKIGDFGCARKVGDRHVAGGDWAGICGTPAYMAPEVARGEEQGFAADVWAFGCTMIEALTGRASWADGLDPILVLYRVGVEGRVPEIPGFVSEEGRDFLGKCLRRDPGERWSASELLKHPFLAGEGTDPEGFIGSGLYLDSPRSVLDCIEFEGMSSGSGCGSGQGSPGERIRLLSGGNAASFWASEEGWVTVRAQNIPNEELCYGPESGWACEDEPTNGKWIETIWFSWWDDVVGPAELSSGLRNCKDRKRYSCGVRGRDRDWKRGLFMTSKCHKSHVLLCDCSNLIIMNYGFLFTFGSLFFVRKIGFRS